MSEARATVVRVQDGQVWLRLEDRPGGCGRCDEPGGCRSTRLADAFKSSEELIRLPDTLISRVGDRVTITVAEGAPLAAALLGYVLPLISMLVLGGLALFLAPFASEDANVAAGVATGLLGGMLTGRRVMAAGRWRHMGVSLKPAGAAATECGGRP